MDYHKRQLAGHTLHPETLMMGFGYDPALSEGSVKVPIFQTSTFVFNSAQHGKDFFELIAGLRDLREGERPGMIKKATGHVCDYASPAGPACERRMTTSRHSRAAGNREISDLTFCRPSSARCPLASARLGQGDGRGGGDVERAHPAGLRYVADRIHDGQQGG